MTDYDPWALTYEDDTAALTDERLAYELLCGVNVRLPNKRFGKQYLVPKSKRERAARAALARLFRKGSPFPGFIRETLAALFDPASATVPAGRRIEFVNLKQSPPGAGLEVALHVWYRLWLGDKTDAAIASAEQQFRLKRRRVFDIYRKYADEMPKHRLHDFVRSSRRR
jgi:hypothetical protein